MKTFVRFLKPYKGAIFLTCLFVVIQSLSDLYLPDLNARIIDEGVMNGDFAVIWEYGAIMLVVAVLVGAATLGTTYFSAKASMAYGRDMRLALFSKVQKFSSADVEQFGTASLITRTTNDVNQMQQTLQMLLRTIITTPIMMIGGIVMALRQDVGLSVILVFIVPIIAVLVIVLMRKSHPMFQRMQKQVDVLNQVLREQLSGIRVIRAFVRTSYEEKRYEKENEKMRDYSCQAHVLMTLMMPIVTLIMNLGTLAAYYFGAYRIDAGQMNVGSLTAFVTYLSQILMSVSMSAMMMNMLPRAMTCMGRIEAVLNTEPSVKDEAASASVQLGAFESLEFRDVSFAYPDAERPVLEHISFTTKPGETTAIIGSTGSGKSTLVNLIPRLYDTTQGEILINGVDIRKMPQDTLRAYLGFVPQKAFLFEGTVATNLQYGKPDASEEEMWHALEVAQGRDFVEAKPDRLQSAISQGGTNVSGGQRQRLAIARAIIRKPGVYIFDDSFSALDFKTDAKLRQALSKETREAAVLIVAQRVTTVLSANRIIVLDEGKIAGMGTHKELMESCQVYREIVLSQLSAEEVA